MRAAWATGIGTNVVAPAQLPRNRLRVVNGASDLVVTGGEPTLTVFANPVQ